MDPVSVAASTIAFIHACRKLAATLRFLSDVSRAPKDILALADELNHLQNVLTAVGLVTRKRRDALFGDLLSPLFERVDRIICELCGVCGASPHKLKAGDEDGEQLQLHLRVRFKWTFAKKRVSELLERLKIVRLDLSNSLAAISLLDISRTADELRHLSSQISPSTKIETSDQLPLQRRPSMILVRQPKSRIEDIEAQSQDAPLIEKSLHSQVKPSRSNISNAGLCRRPCSCVCHVVYRVKSPGILEYLVGSLLVKHHGLYGLNQACNDRSCRRSTTAIVRVSYRFPDWLLNRMVSSVLLSNHVDGPQFSLVVPRIRPDISDIFSQCVVGNINSVAKLLGSGLASPSDIGASWGTTPLHIAVDRGRMDLARFLLNAGARADITNTEERTVTDDAWNLICLKKVSTERAAELEAMFKKDTWFEERQFTLLHKIVLDLLPSPRDLEEELLVSTASIDTADSEGRTPLSWAAELGNLSALQALLHNGADMSCKCVNGNTALHSAAKAPDPACFLALIEHGAYVHAKNKYKHSPLNFVTYCQNDQAFVHPLLDRGVDVNEKDRYGSTPLNGAVFQNNDRTARCLIERGARTGGPDLNVINDAIENNSHECTSLLLDYGVDLSTADSYGETPFHVVARRGDLRTIGILQAADQLEGVDIDARTNEGLTASDIMRQRVDVTDELLTAFEDLTAKLQPTEDHATYFDAIEEISPEAGVKSDHTGVKVEEVLVG